MLILVHIRRCIHVLKESELKLSQVFSLNSKIILQFYFIITRHLRAFNTDLSHQLMTCTYFQSSRMTKTLQNGKNHMQKPEINRLLRCLILLMTNSVGMKVINLVSHSPSRIVGDWMVTQSLWCYGEMSMSGFANIKVWGSKF